MSHCDVSLTVSSATAMWAGVVALSLVRAPPKQQRSACSHCGSTACQPFRRWKPSGVIEQTGNELEGLRCCASSRYHPGRMDTDACCTVRRAKADVLVEPQIAHQGIRLAAGDPGGGAAADALLHRPICGRENNACRCC